MHQNLKALFLDRDGILNKEIGDYVCTTNELEILPHAIENCKLMQQLGYKLIVITNQGGIAKGRYTLSTLKQIHEKLTHSFLNKGVQFDDIFFCPHHPDFGNCLCRKPKSLLIEKALGKHHLSASQSIMIGDTDRDIEAAKGAGVTAFLSPSNKNWIEFIKPYIR
jgi:D-glycero-D-manno-heptose 1,7-bisphosphate phosphatase